MTRTELKTAAKTLASDLQLVSVGAIQQMTLVVVRGARAGRGTVQELSWDLAFSRPNLDDAGRARLAEFLPVAATVVMG